MKNMKLTKKEFCIRNPKMSSLRRKDPIQFNVLYSDWVREKDNNLKGTI